MIRGVRGSTRLPPGRPPAPLARAPGGVPVPAPCPRLSGAQVGSISGQMRRVLCARTGSRGASRMGTRQKVEGCGRVGGRARSSCIYLRCVLQGRMREDRRHQIPPPMTRPGGAQGSPGSASVTSAQIMWCRPEALSYRLVEDRLTHAPGSPSAIGLPLPEKGKRAHVECIALPFAWLRSGRRWPPADGRRYSPHGWRA